MIGEKGFDMVFAGVGGQGIVMLSNAIGNACAEAGEKAITGELHGLSQRSGSVYIHMRIGGNAISPLIPYGQADAIVALEAMEALRYIEFLKDDGVIIMNSRLIHSPIEVAQLSKEKRTDFITFDSIIEK
jgi:indolepyruvate ferredoxin oxidoreductase beta subunit